MTREAGRRSRVVRPVVLSSFLTLAVFVLVEVAVRLLDIQPQPWPSYDNPLALDEIVIDPLLGAMARPGWSQRWHGMFDIQIDQRGFRTTGLSPPSHPRRRVVLIGDSCSFGFGVDTPDWFLTRLDARQREGGEPRVELTSVAYQGYSAVVGEYVLRERGLPLRPDMVLIAFSANNAFRFSAVRDAERFRHFAVRKLVLRSRALHVLASYFANRARPSESPRDRKTLAALPVRDLQRVAGVDDYAAALEAMAYDTRAAGAEPVFVLIPRASEVSTEHAWEDVALAQPPGPQISRLGQRELYMLEASCLETRAIDDPLATLRREMPKWKPVFPRDERVRGDLIAGAAAYVKGARDEGIVRFRQAAETDPTSPLAWYALGVAQLETGAANDGVAALSRADDLACNVFVHYQVAAWKLAQRLGVRVVDVTLPFLARNGESLYVDPAHPNPAGHAIIAAALWPLLSTPD
jgi:lysophospholipase L1-like esterase